MFRRRIAQRRTLSSDIPRYNPPAEAEEKEKEEAKEAEKEEQEEEEDQTRDRNFLRRPRVWMVSLYTDYALLHQTFAGALANILGTN